MVQIDLRSVRDVFLVAVHTLIDIATRWPR